MKVKKGPVKKILILSANPVGTDNLRLDEEVREIEEGLRHSEFRDQFEIYKEGALRKKDLRRALLRRKPQILHFIGHGEKSGLVLEDMQGFATYLSPEALSELLKLCADVIECVILNACYSVEYAEAINQHIRYVIGMQAKIKDKAAIEFAVGFYDALGAGKSVEEAFEFGRNAIRQCFPDSSEHSIPELETNDKIPPKKLGFRKKSTLTRIRPVFLALIIFTIIVSVWLGKTIEGPHMDNNINVEQLVAHAREAADEDPTLALNLAKNSWLLNKNKSAKAFMQEISRENRFYKIASTQNDGVTSLAVSDQERYLTGSPGGTVRLWDHQGKLLQTFSGHNGWVGAVAFSPDGQLILSSANDGTVKLWNQEGHIIRTFRGHEEPVSAAAISPDSHSILTGSTDRTARLWNLEGNLLHTFNEHSDSITTVAFSPDGQFILTGSFDESVRVWDLSSKVETVSIETGKSVHSAAFSPDGKYIVTGLDQGYVRLWNMNGEELLAFIGHQEEVYSVAFSPDGKYILTGSKDKIARLWDLEGTERCAFKGHKSFIYSAVFSHDGRRILTGSYDGTVRIWEIEATLENLLKNKNIEPLTKEQKQKYGIKN